MVLYLYLFALFLVAALYVWLVDDPGTYREQAVTRLGRILWGGTIGAIVGGLATFVGLLWFAIGATWMFIADSRRFVPKRGWKQRLRRLMLWPYELIVWGVTKTGGKPGLVPPF